MIRKTANIVLFILLLLPMASAGNIVITEVYFNPINESGSEFIELFNPTDQSIDIGDYIVSTEASAADAAIPQNTTILPKKHYLVADSGWSKGKDGSTWPDADYEEAITLTNTDSGIALIYNNQTIDAIGWGNALNINSELYEGTPAESVAQGESLQRKKDSNGTYLDTGNNLADFIPANPNPETSSSLQIQEAYSNITAVAIVGSSSIVVETISILTDDDSRQGIQVMPIPNKNKEINLTAQISDFNGYQDIAEVNVLFESQSFPLRFLSSINSTTALFNGLFNASYYLAPGNHSINVTARSLSNLTNYSASEFEYLSLIALEFDASSIIFSANPGQSYDLVGDLDMNTPNSPTIRNIGNTNLNLQLSGSNLVKGQNSIGVNNILYSFSGGDFNSSFSGALSNSRQNIPINLSYGTNALKSMSFRLGVPLGTPAGSYFGSISIVGVGS